MKLCYESKFGKFLKSIRKSKRITLKAFCEKSKADPANICRLENECVPPPQKHEVLERYAQALDIQYGSDEWYLFFDLANSDNGIIPKDLMENKSVKELLPAFFRTVRGQKASLIIKRIKERIEKIKRGKDE